mgnify:CR=1 FL=1
MCRYFAIIKYESAGIITQEVLIEKSIVVQTLHCLFGSYAMEMQANDERCLIINQESDLLSGADSSKVRFMIGSKFRKATKGRFLGFAWLVLDPLIISLIYFFVF